MPSAPLNALSDRPRRPGRPYVPPTRVRSPLPSSPTPAAEPWAARIRLQLGKSVEAIIDVGHLLLQAKASLAHGEWGRLFVEQLVPFNQDAAERLMAIASHPVLSHSANLPNLPTSWTTLFALAKLPPAVLTQAIQRGVVCPEMRGRDAKALLPSEDTPAASTPANSEVKTEHCDVRVDPVLLRVLQFVAARHAQTVADFVRLGLWSVIHESLSEGQVRAVIGAFGANPTISNSSLEQIVVRHPPATTVA